MFSVTENNICHDELVGHISDPRAGAMVFFDGRVRNHNEGHHVTSLEYQSYESMALKEGLKIIDEAISKFDIYKAHCIHRVGHLQIEEVAVWVGVSSAHRQEAFKACQYIIDEVKTRVPMWKKEHYLDLPSVWVECHQCGQANHHHHESHGNHHDV